MPKSRSFLTDLMMPVIDGSATIPVFRWLSFLPTPGTAEALLGLLAEILAEEMSPAWECVSEKHRVGDD